MQQLHQLPSSEPNYPSTDRCRCLFLNIGHVQNETRGSLISLMSRFEQVPCPHTLMMQDWIYIIKTRVLLDPAPVTEEETWKCEQRLGRGRRSGQLHARTAGAARLFHVGAAG